MIQKLLELYAKWKMKNALDQFSRAWREAEETLKRAGWSRGKRRQLRRELLKGHSIDWGELK